MDAAEKGYYIREFACMTGLPQSKIRYYEKIGLFRVKRMKNGYRWFTPEDAFRVNAFRSLLRYGFSIEAAIRMLDEKQQTAQFEQSLKTQRKTLTKEKQLLEYRLQALDDALELLNLKPGLDFSIQDVPDKLYVYASRGRDFSVAAQVSETITLFVELLSISNYARIVDTAQFSNAEPEINPSYVSAIPASEEWRLGDYDPTHVHRLNLGKCLVYHRSLTREESVRKESFAPVLEWLTGHGYRMRGKMLILPAFLNLDGCGTDMETVILPVY